MMDFLSRIGDIFNAITSPIDFLIGFIVLSAVESMNFILYNIMKLMLMPSKVVQEGALKDIAYVINYFVYTMAGAVGAWHIFRNMLKVMTDQGGKSFRSLCGDFLEYGLRLVSLPFFFYVLSDVNALLVKVFSGMGINPTNLMVALGVDKNSPAAFLERIAKIFVISESSVFIAPLVGLALFILFAILLLQTLSRIGEVAFLYLFIPLVAVSVLTEDLDMYSAWWRNGLSIFGTQILQLIGIYLSFQFLIDGNGLFGIGILLATVKTPQIAKEYTTNSGVSSGLKNLGGSLLLAFR